MAQAFEFHFNPRLRQGFGGQAKNRGDLAFDSFCYEPINIVEKRLGNLYVVGEIINALPESHQFLNSLAYQVKKDYYLISNKLPEAALSKSLKKTNEFLSQELQKENVNWLGNLNLAILSLSLSNQPKKYSDGRIPAEGEARQGRRISRAEPKGRSEVAPFGCYNFYFTKLGNIKILLQRGKKLIDICSNLNINEIEPYPLKVFSNILSGELFETDLIFVLTQDVYNLLLEEKIFHEIVNTPEFEEKIIKGEFIESVKKTLNQKREILSKATGVFLLIDLIRKTKLQKNPLFIIREKELSFLFEAFTQIVNFGKSISPKISAFKLRLKKHIISLNFLRNYENFTKIRNIPHIKTFSVSYFRIIFRNFVGGFTSQPARLRSMLTLSIPKCQFFKKNLILLSVLALVLLSGFFIFQRENEKNLKLAEANLKKIEEKINLAQNLLILNKEKEANLTFQDAWKEILPLTKTGSPIIKPAESLKEKIENLLYPLNNLEKIENPQLIFELKERSFSPKNIFLLGEDIYIFSPISENLFKLSKSGEINSIQLPQKFDLATVFDNSLLFFKNPNIITPLRKNEFGTPISLENYSSDLRFNGLFVFNSNFYFWDSKNCSKIIKYSYLGNLNWANPENWFKEEYSSLFCPATTSITVDGSIWISADGSEIKRFYGGIWQESLLINIFPFLEKPAKIWASPTLPYLYILEPTKNRILIITKSGLPAIASLSAEASAKAGAKAGEVIKQFQSEKFDNLRDFTVSEDGKIIYFLNGNEIYQISI